MKEQDRDLLMRFDAITKKLRDSGIDLSGVNITTNLSHNTSYITKRIMAEMEENNKISG